MLVVGIFGAELFLSRMSLIVLISGLVIFFLGWAVFRAVLFPLFFLVLMVPIPAIVFSQITLPLQILASKLAAWTLPVFGVPVLREGNIINLPAMPLEDLLTPDHHARTVWRFVQGLDLTSLLDGIRAVEGRPGRPATDPQILVTLWLFATIEGVGSARALDWLYSNHHGFRWICGGVSVNYHTLSDFRVEHVALLDDMLTHSVAPYTVVTLEKPSLRIKSPESKDKELPYQI